MITDSDCRIDMDGSEWSTPWVRAVLNMSTQNEQKIKNSKWIFHCWTAGIAYIKHCVRCLDRLKTDAQIFQNLLLFHFLNEYHGSFYGHFVSKTIKSHAEAYPIDFQLTIELWRSCDLSSSLHWFSFVSCSIVMRRKWQNFVGFFGLNPFSFLHFSVRTNDC